MIGHSAACGVTAVLTALTTGGLHNADHNLGLLVDLARPDLGPNAVRRARLDLNPFELAILENKHARLSRSPAAARARARARATALPLLPLRPHSLVCREELVHRKPLALSPRPGREA